MSDLRNVVLEALSQIDTGESETHRSEVSDRDMLSVSLIDEREFLSVQREKLLLLFEGLLSPEIENLEDKLELTLRYLQFQLAEIDKRLSKI
ncbi:CiaD-like domain-containing protein [Helicobacter pametensis]|uniref:CiaD-like domain-containing protein n=1 Tax=Helicobacter pametensis TaxID=95149 RepID=UPI0004BC931E|nr:hypothetical protein [Helicobacter pametensis]